MNFLFRRSIIKRSHEIKLFSNHVSFAKIRDTKKYVTISHRLDADHKLVHRRMEFNTFYRYLYDNNDNIHLDDIEDITHIMQYTEMMQYQLVKNLLYPNSTEPLILKLNTSESIQELFNIVKENLNQMEYSHITQAILVLWDLQKMFSLTQNNQFSEQLNDEYLNQLTSYPDFNKLIELAKDKHDYFDAESFSCFLLYTSKLGIPIHGVFIERLQMLLSTNISLSALSRILVAVRTEPNLSTLFLVQDAIPTVINELDKCESLEDLKLITICLNHLHQVVTNDLLQKYLKKVKDIVPKCQMNENSYRPFLKIVSFLNFSQWNNECRIVCSEIILLMKNNLHLLSVYDLFILFEAMHKNHEPGELLTEMQRCSRFFLRSSEDSNLAMEIKLKLLSCIICLSSPMHRFEYEKLIANYTTKPLSLCAINDLLRILTFIKPSNVQLCNQFWSNTITTLESNNVYKDIDVLLKFCHKYMNYSNDMRYRHRTFEKYMINWLEDELYNGTLSLIPSRLSVAAAFVLGYGDKTETITFIVRKITENWEQFNHIDCLYISKGIRNFELTRRSHLTPSQLYRLNEVMDKIVSKNLVHNEMIRNSFLLKSCIYRRRFDKRLTDKIVTNFNTNDVLTSSSLRNIVLGLHATSTLLPDLIESISTYVIRYKDHLLGFNAEKVAYLCYYLGYVPKNFHQLFQAVADVIIRDQERISGLSYIHAALSLCFFNKLPDSIIKQIFNVNFLEKLDVELSHCYSKERYPVRVRNNMMQLNRAVCLDYPQANIPWFHQKYIEQQLLTDKESHQDIRNIKEYLLEIVQDPQLLQEDVITPYGYHVDFLIDLDDSGNPILKKHENARKLAILLMTQSAYTVINVQLKGEYQLKNRHLEILGYNVVTVDVNELNSLIYGKDKIEHLNKLIYPKNEYSRTSSIVEI